MKKRYLCELLVLACILVGCGESVQNEIAEETTSAKATEVDAQNPNDSEVNGVGFSDKVEETIVATEEDSIVSEQSNESVDNEAKTDWHYTHDLVEEIPDYMEGVTLEQVELFWTDAVWTPDGISYDVFSEDQVEWLFDNEPWFTAYLNGTYDEWYISYFGEDVDGKRPYDWAEWDDDGNVRLRVDSKTMSGTSDRLMSSLTFYVIVEENRRYTDSYYDYTFGGVSNYSANGDTTFINFHNYATNGEEYGALDGNKIYRMEVPVEPGVYTFAYPELAVSIVALCSDYSSPFVDDENGMYYGAELSGLEWLIDGKNVEYDKVQVNPEETSNVYLIYGSVDWVKSIANDYSEWVKAQ